MELPRCGVPDIFNGTNWRRRLSGGGGGGGNNNFSSHWAYFPSEPKWPPDKSHLTYAWLSTDGFDPSWFLPTRDAFETWALASEFSFEEAANPADADIKLGFFTGDHGDGRPFDGPGRTVGHAFAPPVGWLHLDAEEHWSTNPGPGQIDVESVLIHEIGHTLGLAHTTVEEAIMYPTYKEGTKKLDLVSDDREGIRLLYF